MNYREKCACGKTIYQTENEAYDAMLHANLEYTTGAPVNFYACEISQTFHLTSKGTPHAGLAKLKSSAEWKNLVDDHLRRKEFRGGS